MSQQVMRTRLLASTRPEREKAKSDEGGTTDEGKESGESEEEESESEGSEDEDEDEKSEDSEDGEEAKERDEEVLSEHVSAIQVAELSPDGTCIFTSEYSKKFSVYVIDQNILQAEDPLKMTPYSQIQLTDPIWAMAASPHFDLSDLSTTTVLLSQRDTYINLYNPLWQETLSTESTQPFEIRKPLASYRNIHPLREHIIVPSSITYTRNGSYFIAGSQNEIAIFNIEYPSAPIQKIKTWPKAGFYNNTRFKGTVSALAVASTRFGGVLAVGTRERGIAFYENEGIDQTQSYSTITLEEQLKDSNDSNDMTRVAGNGVSSIKWSPCATYLYIAERNSDIIYTYDIRNAQAAVSYCTGRNALTPNKLGFDVFTPFQDQSADNSGVSHHELWAGGVDGKVRIWRDPHLKQGAVKPESEFEVGDDPVTNTLVHASGALAVVASGYWEVAGREGGRKRMVHGGMVGMPRIESRGRVDILGLSLEARPERLWEAEMVERLAR
ncbi:WD40 repeat-like protein [Amniculicola lignicola CBS 123094]|uniref:WD40 repeat-like protein n=1 Tax=Amniculicola lignicola CBS 123094 TaxID=1392246 RepID=A0A6A5W9N3_9PLEO|nr:WD40 repeat-like protein [Amniculicola lignicola CBS 123094]